MSRGKALVLAVVTALAVIGWWFVESVLSEEAEESGLEPRHAEPVEPVESAKAPAPAEPTASSKPAVPDGATKAELYEIATELGVEGRSKMNKAELAEAIEKAS
jgi:hypothetical protein